MTKRGRMATAGLAGLLTVGLASRVLAIACPSGQTKVRVCVQNPTGSLVTDTITISGAAITYQYSCTGASASYSGTISAIGAFSSACLDLPGGTGSADTGMWVHRISVSGTGQAQAQKMPVLYSSIGAYPQIAWTYFPGVVTVNQTGDAGSGSCTTNCTFRQALTRANSISGGATYPVLIQFTVSPGNMTQSASLDLAGNGYITIDATDNDGNPWVVGDANASAAGTNDPFPRQVDLRGVTAFSIFSSNNTIRGLAINNTLAAGSEQTKNLIYVRRPTVGSGVPTPTPGGPPFANRIERVAINGGNQIDCTGAGQCTNARDLINVEGAGSSAGNPAVTIRYVEGHSGLDKGVKSAYGGWAVVEDSWFRNNYRGGLQATLDGKLKAVRSTVEKAGRRASDDLQVDNGANGLASNSGASRLETNANVVRNNILRGITINGTGTFIGANDYVCGSGANGVAVPSSPAPSPVITAQGIAGTYNTNHAVALAGFSSATFGDASGSANPGRNAFTANSQCDFENTSGTAVNLNRNQWRGLSTDICSGSPVNRNTSFDINPQNSAITLAANVVPSNVVLKGQTIRTTADGGFNAIAGNPVPTPAVCTAGSNPSTSCCRKKDKSNTCSGTAHVASIGNCVELVDALGSVKPLSVTSVTPTTIVAEIPDTTYATSVAFLCQGDQGEELWVSKKNSSNGDVQDFTDYCN